MRSARHEHARFAWLSPPKMAKEIGVTPEMIIDRIKAGDIEGYNFGTARKPLYLVPPEAWQKYKESRRVA